MKKQILSGLILLNAFFASYAQQTINDNVIAGANSNPYWQGFKSNGPTGKWGFQQNEVMFMGIGSDVYSKGFSTNAMGIMNGSQTKEDIFLYNVNSPNADFLVLKATGNVGIGTTSPWAKVDIRTAGANASDQNALNLNNPSSAAWATVTMVMGSAGESSAIIAQQRNNLSKGASLTFWTSDNTGTNHPRMTINDAGSVSIGALDAKGYRLAVNGHAIFTKAVVKLQQNWPDYVFQPNFQLRPLSEVEQYIQQHHHLPEVPSAEEVKKDGLDLGDNQATLLKKIEELTLYVIELNKKYRQLEADMKAQKKENDKLRKIKTLHTRHQ